MTKHSIKLHESKSPHNYGWFPYPISEEQIMDKIMTFCNENNLSLYKHFIRESEENLSETEFYSPKWNGDLKIPICDKTIWADLYCQSGNS